MLTGGGILPICVCGGGGGRGRGGVVRGRRERVAVNLMTGVREARRAWRGAAAADDDVYGAYLCRFHVTYLARVGANPTTVTATSC